MIAGFHAFCGFMREFLTVPIVNIEDLRKAARRRLPRSVFDYIDGGAEGEVTLRENTGAFGDIKFLPKCAVETPTVDLSTSVLGIPISMPILFAPVGSTRMFWPRGEEAAAGVAGESGTIYCLSTLSGTRLEEVKKATKGPAWFQLYLCGGRDIGRKTVARAREAGYSALILTVDTAVAGHRERDSRNGSKELLTRRLLPMLPHLPQILSRPSWLAGFLGDGGVMKFPNVMLPDGPMPYADVAAALAQSTVIWSDLKWIRELWNGPIVIKGIHRADDAKRAVDEGADAIVVSNHGGRQLDTVPATIKVLPDVVKAVGDRTTVLLDGGIRRGGDVVKALCLGARAVLIGRAYAYGVAATGADGVRQAVDILRTDMLRTMKLLGCASVRELDQTYVSCETSAR